MAKRRPYRDAFGRFAQRPSGRRPSLKARHESVRITAQRPPRPRSAVERKHAKKTTARPAKRRAPQRKRSPQRKRPPPKRPPQKKPLRHRAQPRKPPKRTRAPQRKRPPSKLGAEFTGKSEYAVSIDYRAAKGMNHNVNAQLSLVGPRGANRDKVERAIAKRLETGKDPRGWNIKWIDWRGREVSGSMQRDFFNVFNQFAPDAEQSHTAERPLSPSELRDWRSEGDEEE